MLKIITTLSVIIIAMLTPAKVSETKPGPKFHARQVEKHFTGRLNLIATRTAIFRNPNESLLYTRTKREMITPHPTTINTTL